MECDAVVAVSGEGLAVVPGIFVAGGFRLISPQSIDREIQHHRRAELDVRQHDLRCDSG